MKVKAKIPERYEGEREVEPKLGDVAPDGWIYAGISEDTHKPMYVSPIDNEFSSWYEARDRALEHEKAGKKDARIPSGGELSQIFNNNAKLGPFHQGYHWSSTERTFRGPTALIKRFLDGAQGFSYKDDGSAFTRFVRH